MVVLLGQDFLLVLLPILLLLFLEAVKNNQMKQVDANPQKVQSACDYWPVIIHNIYNFHDIHKPLLKIWQGS